MQEKRKWNWNIGWDGRLAAGPVVFHTNTYTSSSPFYVFDETRQVKIVLGNGSHGIEQNYTIGLDIG